MPNFPKTARLSRPEDYRRVFDAPALKVSSAAFILLALHTKMNGSRIGVIIAKKHVKKATRRNRLKRLVREQFRNNRLTQNFDLVVLARPAANDMDNAEVMRDLTQLWADLRRKACAQ